MQRVHHLTLLTKIYFDRQKQLWFITLWKMSISISQDFFLQLLAFLWQFKWVECCRASLQLFHLMIWTCTHDYAQWEMKIFNFLITAGPNKNHTISLWHVAHYSLTLLARRVVNSSKAGLRSYLKKRTTMYTLTYIIYVYEIKNRNWKMGRFKDSWEMKVRNNGTLMTLYRHPLGFFLFFLKRKAVIVWVRKTNQNI